MLFLFRKQSMIRTSLLRSFVYAAVPFFVATCGNLNDARGQVTLPQPLPAPNATTDAARLEILKVPSELIGTVGAKLQIKYHNVPNVAITTDPKTGQLMVMAPTSVLQSIQADVQTMLQSTGTDKSDAGRGVASSRQQAYALKNLSWQEIEDAIRRLGGPQLTVTLERNGELAMFKLPHSNGVTDILQVDRRLNQVTFLGSGPTVAGWAQVVYSLDQGQRDATKQTHAIPLAPAEPRSIRKAIQLVKASAQQEGNDAQAEAEVNVEDGDEPATAIGSVEDLSTASGLFGDVQIEFVDDIGIVIVRGSKRDVQRTLEVIQKIKDQAKETQPDVEVLVLQHANSQAVADLVRQLYDAVYLNRQGPVSITALGQPNAILLIGRKEVNQSVKDLVTKIDQPLGPQEQLKVVRLLHASSVDVEARIREFFVERPGSDQNVRVGLGTRVKVLSDFRTNSLVIQAAPREMEEVERLIGQLDVEGTSSQSELRVFRLKNTLSDDLVEVIQGVITGETTQNANATQATPPSGKLSIVTVDGGKIESGILAGVVITSDPTVNALVVRAPAQSMALIGQLIEQLDQLPSAEARIKVFQLENGDATSLALTLQQLFGLPATAGQSASGGLFGLGGLQQQAALTTGGESSLVQMQITYDTRTNSIIASGSSTDLEVIEALLLRLDEEGVESRRTDVIWLRNANATDVATALTNYLTLQRQAVQTTLVTGGVISLSEQVDREVFVVAEPQTNSILLSATPRYYETMLSVIERLDRRPPLVAIQVLIAEVQLDDTLELGAEWGIQDGLLFDRGVASAGTLASPVFNLGNPQTVNTPLGDNVAGQGLSSFGVGRASTSGVGGLVLSASSEAVGVLLRALQTSNRMQVLSRPQITTLDSREAATLVGQQVPRVQGVTQTAGVGQTIQTTDVAVGLGLAVLPRVNQDGLIVMQVQVQNSSVGNPDAGIPVGFGPNGEVIRSPLINTTEASTTVSAYSGQTVVFAGLITKNRTSVRRQIPILGSIPLIGAAFRFDTETESRRELMVILTPRIIQTDEDYEVLKQVESSRMSWCLADVLNIHGDVGVSGGNGLWGPAKSAVIYPDVQPTVLEDRSTPRPPPYTEPVIIDDYMGMQNGSVVEPAAEPQVDVTTANQANSPFRTIGFQSAAQQPATDGGVQTGAY